MKCRGRIMILFCVLAFGIIGAFMRGYELAFWLDPVTNIFESGGFGGYILPIISIAFAIISILIGKCYSTPVTYSAIFSKKSMLHSALYLICAITLTALGIFKIATVLNSFSATQLIYGILTVICGISLILLMRPSLMKFDGDAIKFILTIHVFWSCFMLILTFMEHPVEPVINVFAYDLIGAILIVLSIYSVTNLIFGEKKLSLLISTSLLAIYFVFVTVGGRITAVVLSGDMRFLSDEPYRLAVFVAIFFYIISNAVCALKCNRSKENENE